MLGRYIKLFVNVSIQSFTLKTMVIEPVAQCLASYV